MKRHAGSHTAADGTPKVGWKTYQEARRAAAEAQTRYGKRFDAYRCQGACTRWHIDRDTTGGSVVTPMELIQELDPTAHLRYRDSKWVLITALLITDGSRIRLAGVGCDDPAEAVVAAFDRLAQVEAPWTVQSARRREVRHWRFVSGAWVEVDPPEQRDWITMVPLEGVS